MKKANSKTAKIKKANSNTAKISWSETVCVYIHNAVISFSFVRCSTVLVLLGLLKALNFVTSMILYRAKEVSPAMDGCCCCPNFQL